MWHHVEVVFTDVSEERIASIFRVEGKNKKIRTRIIRQRLQKQSSQKCLRFVMNLFKIIWLSKSI
jgi:hypothetical protein